MSNVEPLRPARVRKRRKRVEANPFEMEGITMGEVVRRLCAVEKSNDEVADKVDKLMTRFTLFFGLGIGAMAASGLISEGAKELILKIIGAF